MSAAAHDPRSEPSLPTAPGRLDGLRASIAEQAIALRGGGPLPPALLDISVQKVGSVYMLRPRDWEQLRHEEGGDGRPVPYWASPWPAGKRLARELEADPPAAGTRVLELGCGLALPSVVAARAGADVLATDGATDAVVFAAHTLALNEAPAEVAHADWTEHGDALVERGPWDLILAADVFYIKQNVEIALRLLPRLGGTVLLADPNRAGARDFLAAARASYTLDSERAEDVSLHRLTPRRG